MNNCICSKQSCSKQSCRGERVIYVSWTLLPRVRDIEFFWFSLLRTVLFVKGIMLTFLELFGKIIFDMAENMVIINCT